MKKRYILEKDYFDSSAARLYKAGESIVLDDKDAAVIHCTTPAAAAKKAAAEVAGDPADAGVEDAAEIPEGGEPAPKAKSRKGAASLMG